MSSWLRKRHVRKLSNLNAMQSHTCALPTEILSLIFLCVIRSPCHPVRLLNDGGFMDDWDVIKPYAIISRSDSVLQAVILAAVCQRWRCVALATPELWRKLRISFSGRSLIPRTSSESLLPVCMSRAGMGGMDLCFSYCTDGEGKRSRRDNWEYYDHGVAEDGGGDGYVQVIPNPRQWHIQNLEWSTFEKYSERLRLLQFIGLPPNRVEMLINPGSFTHLIDLRLQLNHGSLNWGRQLVLRRLIDGLGTQLRALELGNVPYELWLDLFMRCPNLVRARCLDPVKPPALGKYSVAHENRVFQHLEWLDWTTVGQSVQGLDSDVLMNTSVPSLRGLRWKESRKENPERSFQEIDNALIRFISSSSHLTHLEINFARGHPAPDSLPTIFISTPGLQSLKLRGEFYSRKILDSIIDTLLSMNDKAGRIPVPKLRSLEISSYSYGSIEGEMYRRVSGGLPGQSLLKVVRQRWRANLVKQFWLTVDLGLVTWDDVVKGFEELELEGLNMTIVSNGEPVSWLQLREDYFIAAGLLWV